jgi:hypothetical protein
VTEAITTRSEGTEVMTRETVMRLVADAHGSNRWSVNSKDSERTVKQLPTLFNWTSVAVQLHIGGVPSRTRAA